MIQFRRPRYLSKKGAAFIAEFEGFCAHPYNDPAGHATIGYGHLLHFGPVTTADRILWPTLSRKKALEMLRRDARLFADHLYAKAKPKMNQAQFDALVSFMFNVGIGAFDRSTLLRELNKMPGTIRGISAPSNKKIVCRELAKWNKAGGKELPGLSRRRFRECRLFATGRYDAP